jgi:hypothetical protein
MKARNNPFTSTRLQQIGYRLPSDLTWDQLIARWEVLGCQGALVGPEGTGKTTLLEQLGIRLSVLGFNPIPLRLDAQTRRLPGDFEKDCLGQAPRGDVILLDGAEQLGHWDWWRFRRRARSCAGLVITTHSAGRLPTLLECRTTPKLLGDIVHELLPGSARFDDLAIAALFSRHQGNLRLALRELYDRFAAQPG